MSATEMSNGSTNITVEGSSQIELFYILSVCLLALLVRNIGLPWIFLGGKFNKSPITFWSKFLLDILFLVMPGVFIMTFFSSSITVCAIVLTTTALVLIFFVVCEYVTCPDRVAMRTVMNKLVDEHYGPTTFVTYFRSIMLIHISQAILAVDFSIFPLRFKKTEHYGHSLMDIGVAACVVADAISSRLKTSSMIEKKESQPWSWKRLFLSAKVLLPLLGVMRTFIIWYLNYHQPIEEYGLHWNFLYTLAAIRITSWLLPKRQPILMFFLFAIFQQSLLLGWEDFVLFQHNPRNSLILQNAEGLVSLMGYVSLHFGSIAIAEFIAKTGIRVKSWIGCAIKLLVISFLLFLTQYGCERFFGLPSRRVANITYVFSQLSLLIFGLGCCLLIQMLNIVAWAAHAPHFSFNDNPFHSSQPDILDSINKYGLWFFLLSNVLTGIINLSIPTIKVTDYGAFCIVTSYMIICCMAVHLPSYQNVNRKVKFSL